MSTFRSRITLAAGVLAAILPLHAADTALTSGVSHGGVIAEAGAVHGFTFMGTAGQRLYYDAIDADFDPIQVALLNPAGQIVHINGNADSDVGPFLLGSSGVFRLVFSGQGDVKGDYKFRLLDLDSAPLLPSAPISRPNWAPESSARSFDSPEPPGSESDCRAFGSRAPHPACPGP